MAAGVKHATGIIHPSNHRNLRVRRRRLRREHGCTHVPGRGQHVSAPRGGQTTSPARSRSRGGAPVPVPRFSFAKLAARIAAPILRRAAWRRSRAGSERGRASDVRNAPWQGLSTSSRLPRRRFPRAWPGRCTNAMAAGHIRPSDCLRRCRHRHTLEGAGSLAAAADGPGALSRRDPATTAAAFPALRAAPIESAIEFTGAPDDRSGTDVSSTVQFGDLATLNR